MSLQSNDLGVFVVLHGPSTEEIMTAFMSEVDNVHGEGQVAGFEIMPGLLRQNGSQLEIEPMLRKPVTLDATIEAIKNEPGQYGIDLTVRVKYAISGAQPFARFAKMPLCGILSANSSLHISYNVYTNMGAVNLLRQPIKIGSQNFWEYGANGNLVAMPLPYDAEPELTQAPYYPQRALQFTHSSMAG